MNNLPEGYVKIGSKIISNDNYDIIATTKDDNIIEISNAVCEDNKITSIVDTEGNIYLREDINIYNKVLFIPGIGYLPPGTKVVYKDKDYELCYGWHTNISNQTILSWYLISLYEAYQPKTLYKNMINDIELVHFK